MHRTILSSVASPALPCFAHITSQTEWYLTRRVTLVNIIFVTWEQIYVSHVFFHVEFKYVIRIAVSPTFFGSKNFFKCYLANLFVLSRYQYVLNVAEDLYYILNTTWEWKLNHDKDSKHVSPIRDSQTVQAKTCTDTLGHETNSKFWLRNTALPVVCRDCVVISCMCCVFFEWSVLCKIIVCFIF